MSVRKPAAPTYAHGSDVFLARAWRVPTGVVWQGVRCYVLDSVALTLRRPGVRGFERSNRYHVRVVEPSSPMFGFTGWLDEDMLSARQSD